jgi:uncharacterized protein (TIGR02001 family)
VNKLLLTSIALLSMASGSAWAVDVTANGGWNSEYIFRGVPQDDSSPFAGVDVTEGGFYGGIWGADVGDGLEIDYYGGYKGTFREFGYGVGATWYTYTDDFDDEYLELNLQGTWSFLTLDIAIGEYDSSPSQNYQFYALTADYKDFYGKIGMFADDFDGEYVEIGYGNTLSVQDIELVDYTFSVIYSSDDLPTLNGNDDISFVLSISKTFDLYSSTK